MANGTKRTVEFVFAADLGGTHLRGALVDSRGSIRHQLKRSTPQGETPDEIVQGLVAAVHECDEQAAKIGSRIHALSVAVPGTVELDKKRIIKAPNLPALDGFDLGSVLQRELKRPTTLENDANAAAVGEMWQGAARGFNSIICITLGTGVGGGIILNGGLWRGANGSAAEVGHMAVDPFAGVQCGCGSYGCLEVYASATAIVRMAREEQSSFPRSLISSKEVLTAAEIHRAGTAGDELAVKVFQRMGTYLGIGVASLINLLDPEIIVIGGGVANGWDLFEQPMRQQVRERAFPRPAQRVKIVPAECGDDAGLLGTARLVFGS
jgi:glucokinase